ncbi:MAG: NAD-dependent epimerase/dehydratase family protein [Verrucomicrobiota bacterium]
MSSSFAPLPFEDINHVLDHTRDLWEAARGCSFFITGGTGFVGIWLLESFLAANERFSLGACATILSRNPEAFLQRMPHLAGRPDLIFIRGDVSTFEIPPGPFDCLIHAATEVADRSRPGAAAGQMDAILEGTRRVLSLAQRTGVKKLLFVSSGAVYGVQPPGLPQVPETWPGAPETTSADSGYGIGKRASEHLLAVHAPAHHYHLKIARCFAFVGPQLDPGRYAIGNFIRDALAGKPLGIQGDGTPLRSYLHAADLAVWLWTILLHPSSQGIYNTGSAESISISACARLVADVINPALAVETAIPCDPLRPVSLYVPDTGRAARELGLRQLISLPEAIRRTAAWLKRPLNS